MPKKSESLRLLESMDLAMLRQLAKYHGVAPAKSAAELRRNLIGHLGTNLDALVSLRGPWTLERWNAFVDARQGAPQGTITGVRRELRRWLSSDTGSDGDPTPTPTGPVEVMSARPAALVPQVGALINGRYKLLDRLGAGGFGTVFAARDQLSGEDELVLKFANDAAGAESVLNEYRKAGSLNHPNICVVKHYDVAEHAGPFVVMRHGGTSLTQLAQTRGVGIPLALHVIRAVAEALDFAHQRRVIHGDVNPGNVLVGKDNHVQITDFGISAFVVGVSGPNGALTQMGTQVKGFHPLFRAPELLHGILKPKSDQYSLALVFCAAVRGLSQFSGPESRLDGLSRAQQSALERALSSEYGRRFATCGGFASAMTDGSLADVAG
jgi:hypothetical protein